MYVNASTTSMWFCPCIHSFQSESFVTGGSLSTTVPALYSFCIIRLWAQCTRSFQAFAGVSILWIQTARPWWSQRGIRGEGRNGAKATGTPSHVAVNTRLLLMEEAVDGENTDFESSMLARAAQTTHSSDGKNLHGSTHSAFSVVTLGATPLLVRRPRRCLPREPSSNSCCYTIMPAMRMYHLPNKPCVPVAAAPCRRPGQDSAGRARSGR